MSEKAEHLKDDESITRYLREDNTYLASEDILNAKDEKVTLTIKDVLRRQNVKAQDGKVAPQVISLTFEEAKKELWVNKANSKRLSALFGNTLRKTLVGKKVTLYVDHNVRDPKTGGTTTGIRIFKADDRGKKAVENIQ